MATDTVGPETDETPAPPEKTPEQVAAQEKKDAAIVKRATAFEDGGIKLATMADAMTFANAAIDSGLVPSGFERASQVVMTVQAGYELGLKPATSLRAFYMTPQNKPALYAEAALALCMKSGLLLGHRQEWTGEGDALTCTYYVLRKGLDGWRDASFSVAQAKQAQLGGWENNAFKSRSGWAKWPQRMTLARARAFILHDVFSDVLMGIPIEGDLDDLDPLLSSPTPPAPKTPPAGGFSLLSKVVDTSKAIEAEVVTPETVVAPAPPVPETTPSKEEQAPEPPSAQIIDLAAALKAPGAPRETVQEIKARLMKLAPVVPAKQIPPGPFAKAVALEMAPKAPEGCGHEEAKKWLKVRPIGSKVVCEDCALEIRTLGTGTYVTADPPA